MTIHDLQADELNSDINVTPLVDVMLVLLVVFMVVAPLLRRDLPIELPFAEHVKTAPAEQLTLTAAADGGLALNGRPVAEGTLGEALRAAYAGRSDRVLFLAADRALPYSRVVDLLDACRAAGVDRVGVLTAQRSASGNGAS